MKFAALALLAANVAADDIVFCTGDDGEEDPDADPSEEGCTPQSEQECTGEDGAPAEGEQEHCTPPAEEEEEEIEYCTANDDTGAFDVGSDDCVDPTNVACDEDG